MVSLRNLRNLPLYIFVGATTFLHPRKELIRPNLRRKESTNPTYNPCSICQKHLFLFPITLEDNRVSPNIEVAQVLGRESQKKDSGRRDSLPSYRKE